MVDFEDDFFAPMIQDESRKKPTSGSGSSRNVLRSSGSSKPSSSSKSSTSSGSSTRKLPSSRESRGSSDHKHGEGLKKEEPKRDSHHRSSRRSGGTASGATAELDYGYGDPSPTPPEEDYGYGDSEPSSAPQPSARSRRQRRCSIADVLNVPESMAEDQPQPPASGAAMASSSSISRAKSMERNIAIPMAADETARKPRARRSSLMGAMGAMGFGGDTKPEPESKDQKKPGQDRDRRRQGTLMDRVGAGDRERASRGGGTSYSDRILSK